MSSLNNFFGARARGGYVWYIQKALEKGFSDMYGSWGGRPSQKKIIQGRPWAGPGFWAVFGPISAVSSLPGQDFDPFEVIFSGFQRQTPLKP